MVVVVICVGCRIGGGWGWGWGGDVGVGPFGGGVYGEMGCDGRSGDFRSMRAVHGVPSDCQRMDGMRKLVGRGPRLHFVRDPAAGPVCMHFTNRGTLATSIYHDYLRIPKEAL